MLLGSGWLRRPGKYPKYAPGALGHAGRRAGARARRRWVYRLAWPPCRNVSRRMSRTPRGAGIRAGLRCLQLSQHPLEVDGFWVAGFRPCITYPHIVPGQMAERAWVWRGLSVGLAWVIFEIALSHAVIERTTDARLPLLALEPALDAGPCPEHQAPGIHRVSPGRIMVVAVLRSSLPSARRHRRSHTPAAGEVTQAAPRSSNTRGHLVR
jgi:hypothetical protein